MYTEFLWLLAGTVLTLGASDTTREPVDRNPEPEAGLLTRTVKVGKASHVYQVYVPTSLRGNRNLPVILFLHGIGQRGEGGFVPTSGGARELANLYLGRIPAIVVLPQCSRGRFWPEQDMEKMAIAALDEAVAEFGGDPNRLYVAGVSMGGYGAWHLASEHSGKFAAIVSVCGGSPLRMADRFAPVARKVGQTPVWVFHGAEDRIVPVSESRNLVKALRAFSNNVKYSEYAGVGHNVWLNVLAEPGLLPWMLSQRLGKH